MLRGSDDPDDFPRRRTVRCSGADVHALSERVLLSKIFLGKGRIDHHDRRRFPGVARVEAAAALQRDAHGSKVISVSRQARRGGFHPLWRRGLTDDGEGRC